MHRSQQEFSETYRNLANEEIAALHTQVDQLTVVARLALGNEIERRRLTPAALEKLHLSELRCESNFDRREKWRRKGMLSELLFRRDPKGALLIFGALILLILITELIRHYR